MARDTSAGRVILVAFSHAQVLDVTGPATVFGGARTRAGRTYTILYASLGGGAVELSAGLEVSTRDLTRLRLRPTDILIVPGGEASAIDSALDRVQLVAWLRAAAGRVRWIASVCSGAFLLAAAGLLEGKRTATHWRGFDELARRFPGVTVDRHSIYVRHDNIWTSAGVTTGIDMALAMVQEDCGSAEAQRLAADLLLYVRRPGSEAQLSQALAAQATESDGLTRGLEWARANLCDATVETFAEHAGLSVRTLHRTCRDQLSTTPGKLLERLRVERARSVLASSSEPLKSLATACGFGNMARMQRAFQRELGMAPHEYRLLHAEAAQQAGRALGD